MRITNSSITRNYTSNLNKSLSKLTDSTTKGSAGGRKYLSMAEDPSSAVRAMNVRQSISKLTGYKDNARHAKNVFSGAESTLMKVSDLSQEISSKYTSAVNGDKSHSDREIIANELEKLRDELLLCANGQYSSRYFFGGTNTQSQPFTVSEDGKTLYYNGVDVSQISKDDPQYAYLFTDAAYVDIGLGMTMQSGADSQSVLSNTAFKNTMNGLEVFGAGEDNIYLVINEMIDSLRSESFDATEGGALLDKFLGAAESINVQITRLGSDTQYLDFTISRLESEYDNLIERQDELEYGDYAELVLNLSTQETVYNAALSMGSHLLQSTLFDYIR